MPLPIPKFIRTAFANAGQRNNIPESTNNITGAAGYNQGFGEINMIPEGAGGIPPDGKDMNGILFDLSSVIQYVQAGLAFPFNQEFASSIGGYEKGAIVTDASDKSVLYQSTINSNLVAPPSEGWKVFTISLATTSSPGIAKVATGAVLRAGENNDSFATALAIKEAGFWPIGVDQSWIDVSGIRSTGVTYTNTTGRPIMVAFSGQDNSIQATLIVNGLTIATCAVGVGPSNESPFVCGIIPAGGLYSVSGVKDKWCELRG